METATTRTAADEAWTLLRELAMAQRGVVMGIAAELGLSPPQLFTLQALKGGEPVPMSDLAGVLRCDASNVTGLVDRLAARGLVERRPAAHDRRIRHLFLTDEGRQLRAAVGERLGRPPAGFDALSEAEARQLRDLLAKVADGS